MDWCLSFVDVRRCACSLATAKVGLEQHKMPFSALASVFPYFSLHFFPVVLFTVLACPSLVVGRTEGINVMNGVAVAWQKGRGSSLIGSTRAPSR